MTNFTVSIFFPFYQKGPFLSSETQCRTSNKQDTPRIQQVIYSCFTGHTQHKYHTPKKKCGTKKICIIDKKAKKKKATRTLESGTRSWDLGGKSKGSLSFFLKAWEQSVNFTTIWVKILKILGYKATLSVLNQAHLHESAQF